jgi:hypothetical protein
MLLLKILFLKYCSYLVGMNMGKTFILKYCLSLVGTNMSASSHRRHHLAYRKLMLTFTSLKYECGC